MAQNTSGDGSDNQQGDDSGVSASQKAVMIVSALLTLALLGYAGWQILFGPSPSPPEAAVVDTEPLEDGEVAVLVRVRNPNDRGLIRATVEIDCAQPPPQTEFTYVPSHDTRTATIVCPEGTNSTNASVASWVQR